MNFLCIYLGEGKGGCIDACKCMGTCFRLLLRNCVMDFDETWYGCSTHGLLKVLLFFGQIRPGHKGPLLQETSSSDWKATATNRMHSNDLEACGKKHFYFWF